MDRYLSKFAENRYVIIGGETEEGDTEDNDTEGADSIQKKFMAMVSPLIQMSNEQATNVLTTIEQFLLEIDDKGQDKEAGKKIRDAIDKIKTFMNKYGYMAGNWVYRLLQCFGKKLGEEYSQLKKDPQTQNSRSMRHEIKDAFSEFVGVGFQAVMERIVGLIKALTTQNTKTDRNAASKALKAHFKEYYDDLPHLLECISETPINPSEGTPGTPGTPGGQGGGSRRKSARRSSSRKSARRSSRRKSAKRSSRRKSARRSSRRKSAKRSSRRKSARRSSSRKSARRSSRRKSARRSSSRKSARRSSSRKSARRSSSRKSLKYKSHKPTKLSFTANDYLIYN